MKVLYLANIPSPYRVNFFNEWGKYCDLTVIFEKRKFAHRDDSWAEFEFKNFQGVFLPHNVLGTKRTNVTAIYHYLKKNVYDQIIVSNFTNSVGILAIEYMRLRHMPYTLESDGGFAKNGNGFKERFKKHIMKDAQHYMSTSKAHDQYYLAYGAKGERVIRYPFTSIYQRDILASPTSIDQKETIKCSLDMQEKHVVLSIGQFVPRKGYDVLLQASRNFDSTIGIYIVGGKPTQEYLDFKQTHNLHNVHFVDFKTKDELKQYYRAADLFVLPTREDVWGLVINEAMAQGLPVITTQRCIAGLELVANNENGFIVPVDDAHELADKMQLVFTDEVRRQEMGQSSLKKIKEYTIESMAEIHCQLLDGNFNTDKEHVLQHVDD